MIANRTGLNVSTVHTLAPAVDMPNHNNSARPAVFRADAHNRSTLVLVASRRLTRGDQVAAHHPLPPFRPSEFNCCVAKNCAPICTWFQIP